MSTPLSVIKKDALTAEGALVWATNVGLAIAAAVPHGLNWTHAGAYIAFVTGLHTVARALPRAVAAQKTLGLPAPTPVDPISPDVIGQAVSDLFKNAGVQPDVPASNAGGSLSDTDTTGEPAKVFDQAAKPEGAVVDSPAASDLLAQGARPAGVPTSEQVAPAST